MSQSDIILVVILTSFFTMLMGIVMLLFRQLRAGRYNQKEQRAELEKLRDSLEHRIYDLQDRLISSEDRWRDVNHLLIDSQRISGSDNALKSKVIPLTGYLKQMGFSEKDLLVDPQLVFVLTPFHTEHVQIFKRIRSVCSDVGLKCLRGDEEYINSDILSHILRLLVKARVIVANIQGRNANVFYELGIAHALGKPTILVSEFMENVPFDVRSRRIILYKNLDQLTKMLGIELARTLVGTAE